MTDRMISAHDLIYFQKYLIREEKSGATIEKYMRDAHTFLVYAGEQRITKELTVAYKKMLQDKNYAIRSINSMLASLNSLLEFMGWMDCKVKTLRLQRQTP